jgi:hypothetical protein
MVTAHGSIDMRVFSGQAEFFSITVMPPSGSAAVMALLAGSSGASAKALAPRRLMAKAAVAIRVNIDDLQSVPYSFVAVTIATGNAINPEQAVHLLFIFSARFRRSPTVAAASVVVWRP